MENRDKWDYPESKPSEGSQIVVSYNGDWLPILSGLIQRISSKSVWINAPDDILEELNDLIYQLSNPVSASIFPTSQMLFPAQFQNTAGSDIGFFINTSARLNGYWARTTPAIHDSFSITFPLAAGNYRLEYDYLKSSVGGIVTLACAEISYSATIDQYNASLQVNQTFTDTFTLAAGQELTFTLAVNSKNASSGNYQQYWQFLVIRKV